MRILREIQASLDGAKVRTRFAPGVTGRLHMGHVANAIYVWGIAKALDGEVVLRLEDHNRERWSREYEKHVLEDLEQLGLIPDLGKIEQFRGSEPSEYRQSDSYQHYEAAVERLQENFNVYACDCIGATGMGSWRGHYDGRCRNRGLTWKIGRRLRIEIPNDPIAFVDIIRGSQTQRPAEFRGDPELRNPFGNWTYHFAVVVDDQRHGINVVVRGKGLLPFSANQILLARMLGWEAPLVWVHHDEIMDPNTGTKLSKRRGALPIGKMMGTGVTPGALLGKAAASVALLSEEQEIDATELAHLFS